MAKVRQHQCPRCGAPLEVSAGTSDVACKYCRTLVHVEAKLESEGVALCGGKGAKLSMTAADLSGGSDAFRFERRPERLERTLGQISGKQRFGVGCGPR